MKKPRKTKKQFAFTVKELQSGFQVGFLGPNKAEMELFVLFSPVQIIVGSHIIWSPS